MDAEQKSRRNPFAMDEACRNCDLCEPRERVVHGYGDVGGDFLFVGEMPDAGAEESGVPFTGSERGEALQETLGYLGLNNSLPSSTDPEVENVYLTYLTRCRHPERGPEQREIDACEPYLNAEIRMINPEVLIPVGERALAEITAEYTTTPAEEFSVAEHHATAVRGRGFLIVPMKDPLEQSEAERDAFIEHFRGLMESDYRQTKGRRKR
jgi:uracil-DNA glycosylase family 4